MASEEGTPGPTDPRRYARLLSAAELGRLLADTSVPPEQGESVTRKLKELALFRGPSALCILTWQDYESPLSLVTITDDKETPIGEPEDATAVGLTAVLVPASDLVRVRFVARFRSDPKGRDVNFIFHTLVWDGKAVSARIRTGALPEKDKEIAL